MRIGSERDLEAVPRDIELAFFPRRPSSGLPHRFSCIIGLAYDTCRFDSAQLCIGEVYQSTARTGPQGSMSDVFRVSTCSGEVIGSAIGEIC